MIKAKELLEHLTDENIVDILTDLGADRYVENVNEIIFPTICHNALAEDSNMKLYYYRKNKKFHCYTDCGETFNIYDLVEKVYTIQGRNKVEKYEDKKSDIDFTFFDIINYIADMVGYKQQEIFDVHTAYKSIRNKYERKERRLKLPTVNDGLLNVFTKTYPAEWIEEGISHQSMDDYNILFSISQNKIIIPHYDSDGGLVGIRGRALNEEEAAYAKYMPVKVENKLYAHPLSQNLYGFNISKNNAKKIGEVIIFEGEKSCLKFNDYFGKNKNISVAVCGSSIKRSQVDILVEQGVSSAVLALDKEYLKATGADGNEYLNKMMEMCHRYANYMNFSIIFDYDNLLELKDSPVDKGKEVFLKLYEKRIMCK